MSRNKTRLTNCFFYEEWQDMGATISHCTYGQNALYECPCEGCEHFINAEDAREIVATARMATRQEDRLISKQAAVEHCKRRLWETALNQRLTYEMAMCADIADNRIETWLDEVPSAEPKTGKWIVWGGMDVSENHGRHKCSECGEFALLRYEKPLRKEILSDFCPNCGARMMRWRDDE